MVIHGAAVSQEGSQGLHVEMMRVPIREANDYAPLLMYAVQVACVDRYSKSFIVLTPSNRESGVT